MQYAALATDYDGTLAHDGQVDGDTFRALERLRASGRKLIMVTGREMDDLLTVFPHERLEVFDRVVAENGALLYCPASHEERPLAGPPPRAFATQLRKRGVNPLSVGRVIVATVEPNERPVLDTIRDLGLELQVIFNKGAVMILPSGVNKATGLEHALHDLGLSFHNVVGVGDAENDHAFLSRCECAVAVANALPSVKERADEVTRGARGAGVTELIERIVGETLGTPARLGVALGTRGPRQQEVSIPPFGTTVLVAGPSRAGKSTLVTGLLETLIERRYQVCLVDPEGDYEGLIGAVSVGESRRPPPLDEVMDVLRDPYHSVVVNLLALKLVDRPRYFATLVSRLDALRAQTGRPSWLVVDEAHHVLPAEAPHIARTLPHGQTSLAFVTLEPDRLPRPLLELADVLIAVGDAPREVVASFAHAVGVKPPRVGSQPLARKREALLWPRSAGKAPFRYQVHPPRNDLLRHRRKYAEADIGPDRSFYFRGPNNALRLRVANLTRFMELADGVDDDTWEFHLRRGDYARWFREEVKDEELAARADRLAGQRRLSPSTSRRRLREAIEARYTAPG